MEWFNWASFAMGAGLMGAIIVGLRGVVLYLSRPFDRE